ncbi:cysteine-rich KTR domain-containing protein [Dorea acetigenes]|uniref:cysteine-rich KTR domain-containing protein n=1 Tax=Dorea acetigenes TaxID=2981787 RepID=UPI003A8A8377
MLYWEFTCFVVLGGFVKVSKIEWVRCPICGNKTRLQIRTDIELKQQSDKSGLWRYKYVKRNES